MNIVTSPDYIGFLAVDDDTYGGPPDPVGWGRTEEEAIEDLMEKLE